jgi:hypothetical protein
MRRTIEGLAQVAVMLLLAVLLAGPAADARAGEFTLDDFTLDSTEDLLDTCTVDQNEVSHWEASAFCYGFFQGALHYHRALAGGPTYGPIVCPTEPVTVSQLVSVFVTYAKANPQHLEEPPIDTAFRALVEQWPCS